MRTGVIAALSAIGGIAIGACAHRAYISSNLNIMNDTLDAMDDITSDLERASYDADGNIEVGEPIAPEMVGIPSAVLDKVAAFAHQRANETGLPVVCVIRSDS